MRTDDQYGHQLGTRLRSEVAAVVAPPDLVSTLRRRRARRSWAIRAAIATPVAAAAAAAILVTTLGHGAPDPARPVNAGQTKAGASSSGSAQFENVAYVRAQTVSALRRGPQYVIYSKTTYSTGYYEVWTDKATPRYRVDTYGPTSQSTVEHNGTVQAPPAPGQETLGPIHLMQSNSVTGPDGNQSIVTVDYDQHTWSTGHLTDPRPPSALPDITDPDSVQKAIADSSVELLGPETVDGLSTLHLRFYAHQRGYRVDMWVDATTFLPVRETATAMTGGPGTPAATTTTYAWLPRTGKNLAQFVLSPPPGFQRVG